MTNSNAPLTLSFFPPSGSSASCRRQPPEVDRGHEEHAAAGQVAGNSEEHDGNVERDDEGNQLTYGQQYTPRAHNFL